MKFIVFLLGLFTCTTVMGQEVVSTDRPTQTPAASLVPAGNFQMESGYSYVNINGTEISNSANSLLRFGLSPAIEFRAFIDYSWSQFNFDGGDRSENGWAPLQLGTKIRISENDGWIPAASFVGMVLLRSGEGSLEISQATPDLRLAFNNKLPGIFDLFYSLGIAWIGEGFTPLELYTIGLGASITPKVWGFVEFFGFFDKTPVSPSLVAGLTWRVAKYIQLDVSGGFDLCRPRRQD
jgi:hypothetical protein